MIAPYLAGMQEKIRQGSEPDNASLIYEFVNQQIGFAKQASEQEKNSYISLFRVLLETAADEMLPRHWRSLCMDYIQQPLSLLWELAESDESKWEVVKLCHEFKTIGDYVASSINNPILKH
ncbi:MAG: hypothetical protein MK188_11485 [Gammaproteobacteria bacterium]|nr:hypothetical protein [Gammaproteobacteria bacterium]